MVEGEVYVELPEQAWYRRLSLEYSLVQEHEPNFNVVDGDLTHYRGVIIGMGYYEGGYFRVEIFLPRSFPYDPPEVVWHTRIWHPNFSDETPARVCDEIVKSKWSPANHVVTVIEALRSLLNEPNPDDPLNALAAAEMKNNPDIFIARVQEYIKKFATPEQAFSEESIPL
ncbi:MAG TPA: ubiquitin-conjugating enzyme E2 [Candidatus Caldiarchaeum subterraneum]|uniref:Ubiquitin-conjugating enzyme E2 n=1 Tax=Caldiarchaeum subterraneum TaxID=311458 RepID=A0A832ZW05_CALS0|nr:ubiquitin-conjugating enzyme E2 [Aigarchaeota archaeon]HIQ29332.1 ubiquitin-conjugating enzyme E2 [Candidatus Caldarchaeum subterraneum]